MPIAKETGFVINTRVVNEIDCIFTLLCENSPKAKFIIKGIKKSKTRSILATEPASLVSVDYYAKGEFLHNVKELTLIERYEKAKTGYTNYLLVSYLCEFTDMFLAEGETYSKCFKIFHALMKVLENDGFQMILLPYYKFKVLLELGFLAGEFYCHECGENVLEKTNSYIDPYTMEIICSDCQNTYKNNIGIIRLLNLLSSSRYSILKELEIDKSLLLETDRILNCYIRNHLHRDLKTDDLLYKSLS